VVTLATLFVSVWVGYIAAAFVVTVLDAACWFVRRRL
jgi:hypothetical protein